MVKPDVKIDYYASLELPANASVDDIKRQYRRLALLYHPDRNPGREDEFSPKFQDIQSAFEILSDETTRAKYDADRRRAGLLGININIRNPTATRANPYTTTSAYPPPPRRTAAPAWTKTSSAQSGADRFSSFPRPSPTSRKDAAAEANVFRAWEQMRTNKTQPQAAQSRPVPPRPQTDAKSPGIPSSARAGMYPPKSAATFAASDAKSAFARHNAPTSKVPDSGSFGARSSRKSSVDESPLESSAFGTTKAARSLRSNSKKQSNAPNPPPRPQPVRIDTESSTPFDRVRTPYTSVSGEKTYFATQDLRRTQSTRDTTKAYNDASHADRHQSASPPKKSGSRTQPFVIYTSSESSHPTSEVDSDSEIDQPQTSTSVPPDRRKSVPHGFVKTEHSGSANDVKIAKGDGTSNSHSIFSIPVVADTFESNASSRQSTQNPIDTAFAASDWSGTFSGSQSKNVFATHRRPSPAKKASEHRPSRLRTASRRHADGITTSVPQSAVPVDIDSGQQPQSAPLLSRFAPDAWEKSDWNFAPATSKPTSRDETSTRIDGVADPVFANQQSAPVSATFATTASPTVEDAPADAMDIDPAPPVLNPTTRFDSDTARPIAVPRSTLRHDANGQPSPHKSERRVPLKSSRRKPSTVKLDDLGHSLNGVNGLDGLGNIATDLPFQSKASSQPPRAIYTQVLTLPQIPVGPDVPTTLSVSTWKAYCAATAQYLAAFQAFDHGMQERFRQSLEYQKKVVQTGQSALEAVGQIGEVGLQIYMTMIKDDERVRECWNIAHEKHAETITRFAEIKERVKKLGEGPGLPII